VASLLAPWIGGKRAAGSTWASGNVEKSRRPRVPCRSSSRASSRSISRWSGGYPRPIRVHYRSSPSILPPSLLFARGRVAYSNIIGNVLIVIVCPLDIWSVAPPYVPLKLL